MSQTFQAVYQSGKFILKNPCDLPEGLEVELWVKSPELNAPQITDLETRQVFLRQLVARMQQNPIPAQAPQFTRDQLHERS